MNPSWFAVLTLLASSALGGRALAHEFDPHLVQISERGGGDYVLRWKAPVTTAARVVWPEHCRSEPLRESGTTRWFAVHCDAPGLAGAMVGVRGLPSPTDPVLLEVRTLRGRHHQQLLRGEQERVAIPERAISLSALQVMRSYFHLGMEHLLFGADHLLFILGLLGLVRGFKGLVAAASAFTVGHALTLCIATLGWLRLPSAPVEACIALSLVWLARELVVPNPESVSRRAPWLVAGAVGLLHGLGFAGALVDLGLPDGQVPAALAAFNMGIEVAQLGVIAGALLLVRVIPKSRGRELLLRVLPVGMGAVATAWLFARVAPLLAI